MSAPGHPGHPDWLAAETDRLLTFARGSVVPGGFGCLDDAGTPRKDLGLALWINCRMTHVFALAHLQGRPGADGLVDHGLTALSEGFHDHQHDGWYAEIDHAGAPVVTDKDAYGHAFVVLAAASATVAERPGAADLLHRALDVLFTRFWDDEHGMVVDQWDRAFDELDPYRGVNANMHTVEALLAAAGTRDDPELCERALRITTRVLHDLASRHDWRIPEHFDATWTPLLDYNRDTPAHPFRPFGATIGHSFEWARLAVTLSQALGSDAPPWLLEDARRLFDAAVRDGWAVDGNDGFIYTIDWDGRPMVRERMHWVAAEATLTASVLHTITGAPAYSEWYQTWWDHIAAVFLDERHGSWHHELDQDNRPSSITWQGKPDVYHAYQAALLPGLPVAPSVALALRHHRGSGGAGR